MSMPERTIGYLAQVACTWEVLARKAGNVCPGREYADLTVQDFLVSAAAIAPVMEQAPVNPIGVTVRRAIEATRRVTSTNTNLGIVLLLAPLASIPLDQPLRPLLQQRLDQLTVEDSRNVYAAIRLANPGGLGSVQQQDVRDEPTLPLREVMGLAREHDRIAEQYVCDFQFVLDVVVPELVQRVQKRNNVEWGIVETQLWLLSRYMDSLIIRKKGASEAEILKYTTQYVLVLGGMDTPQGRRDFVKFDAWLRADNHARNPGTTADLLAACLFVALREERIALTTPFVWEDHPFAEK